MNQSFLGLPKTTEINKQLPKTKFFSHFGTNSKEQNLFNEEISKIYISNLIAENTIALKPGKTIKLFYVIKVLIKNKNYSDKSILIIAKSIPQNMIFAICYDQYIQIALYYNGRLYKNDWSNNSELKLKLEGLDIEAVWNNCISNIANLEEKISNTLDLKNTLEKQAKLDNLKKQLDKLERGARNEVQPRQKYELVQKKKSLEKEIEILKNEGN